MKINPESEVGINYTLTINGRAKGQSGSEDSATYIQGQGDFIPGLTKMLEEALLDQESGAQLNLNITVQSVHNPKNSSEVNGMNISENKAVEIEYTLTVNGEVVDQSESGEPLTYLQGHGNIIPGLEQALDGKAAGDHLQVTVQPEDGYGERDEEAIQVIAREDFDDDIEVGATYFAQAEDGSVTPFTVISLEGDDVTVDFNPPLAGEVLHFDVTVKSVRDATADELEHGHAHGDDAHEEDDF